MTRALHVRDPRFPIGTRVRYNAEARVAFRPRAGVVVGHPSDRTLVRVHWDFNRTGNTYVAARYLERDDAASHGRGRARAWLRKVLG